MPTEFFELAEVTPSITRLLVSERSTLSTSSHTVDNWRGALEEGGWTLYSANHAQVSVTVNINTLPVRTPEPPGGDADKADGSLVCLQPPFITVTPPGGDTDKVWGWDPGAYTEPPCTHFSFGSSQAETYDHYKRALAAALGMDIKLERVMGDGVMEVTFESALAGPGLNGTRVGGHAGGTVWYGGWVMKSGTYRGHFLTVSGAEGPGSLAPNFYAMSFTVRLHQSEWDPGGPGSTFGLGLSTMWERETPAPPYSGPLSLVPASGSGPDTNTGAQESWYRITVCPYQFAIWLEGGSDTNPGPGPRSLFVSMPWVPEGYTGHDAFVFGANFLTGAFRDTLMWMAQAQFDTDPWSTDSFWRIIIPVMRTRIHQVVAGTASTAPDRLTNTQGALLADNAWVSARRENSGSVNDNRIAGKLWNCCVLHDSYPVSVVSTEMMDAQWVHVSSEQYRKNYSTLPYNSAAYGAQRVSVWWKVEKTV